MVGRGGQGADADVNVHCPPWATVVGSGGAEPEVVGAVVTGGSVPVYCRTQDGDGVTSPREAGGSINCLPATLPRAGPEIPPTAVEEGLGHQGLVRKQYCQNRGKTGAGWRLAVGTGVVGWGLLLLLGVLGRVVWWRGLVRLVPWWRQLAVPLWRGWLWW